MASSNPVEIIDVQEVPNLIIETNKYLYRGYGLIIKTRDFVTGVVTTTRKMLKADRMQLKITSKYMPHQGEKEKAKRR